jgi:hypothetical protein
MPNYFYRDQSGKEIGPLSLTTLAQLRFARILDDETPVRASDSEKWMPCRDVAAAHAAPSASPAPPVTSQPVDMRKGRSFFQIIIIGLVIIGALACGAVIFLKTIASETTLSYEFSLGGQKLSAFQRPIVEVDGRSFTNENNLKPGNHEISVSLENAEPYKLRFWVFYGDKNLGMLPLEYSKGSVDLSADSSDAEFEFSGNELHRQGKLPIQISNVRVGTYDLRVMRKGWEFKSQIAVSRNSITTNRTEFPYASIEVTSDPVGMAVLTNGVEIGKTPITLQELIPGQYTLTASDGENDLMADVNVASREAAKHNFAFHYGAVQLLSTPTGAVVIRKGKGIGKTPLTINHIPAGVTTVELRLQGYASTNFIIEAVEGVTTDLSVKLVSEQFLTYLNEARNAISADPPNYPHALQLIDEALKIYPDDTVALQLHKDYEFRQLLNEAHLSSADLDAELLKVDAALALKPADPEAIDLKKTVAGLKTQRDQTAAAKTEQLSDERRNAAGLEFEQIIQGVLQQEKRTLFVVQVVWTKISAWKVRSTSAQAQDALLRAVELGSIKWRVVKQNNPDPDMTVIYLHPRNFLATGDLVVQICQLPDDTLDVRAKMLFGVIQDINQAAYTQNMAQMQEGRFQEFRSNYSNELKTISRNP